MALRAILELKLPHKPRLELIKIIKIFFTGRVAKSPYFVLSSTPDKCAIKSRAIVA